MACLRVVLLIVTSLLSFEYVVFASDSKTSTAKAFADKLYWKPNQAGMFSQLLQTKLMSEIARKANRQLIVDSFFSKHYENKKSLNICMMFEFSNVNIVCGPRKTFFNCAQNREELEKSRDPSVCFNDLITLFPNHGAVRDAVVGAVSLDIPFSIQESRLQMLESFRKDFLDGTKGSFTVVHWRRGDQEDRCSAGIDLSVNCKSAEEFIAEVKKQTKDTLIYVATNEVQTSMNVKILHAAGFKTFSNIGSAQSHAAYSKLDSLSILAIEYSLMIEATTFLAWGVSEVDDVVEHERMKAGKTHCVAQDSQLSEHEKSDTFCRILKKQSPRGRKHNKESQ